MALAAFTGMRRGEILGLCWKDLELAKNRLYLTETKNGTLRVLTLNRLAVQVLKSLPQGKQGELVFPNVNAAHLSVCATASTDHPRERAMTQARIILLAVLLFTSGTSSPRSHPYKH